MKVLSDFHVHSHYSGENGHAEGSLRQLVQAARENGIKKLAITDHGPGHLSYGLDKKKLKDIRAEIDKLNEEFDDIEILLGTEANIVGSKGQIDIKNKDLKYFDLVNVGYHYGVLPKDIKFFYSFYLINNLAKLIRPLRNYAKKLNTDAMVAVIKKNIIFAVTHPGSKAEMDIKRLANECIKRNTALEINSSRHGRLSVEDIKEAMETDVKFTLGSDSHRLERVGDLSYSIERLEEAGLDKKRIINQFD